MAKKYKRAARHARRWLSRSGIADMKKPKPLWEKKNPKKESIPLSKNQKADAKQRARSAGRPYPNAVDNIAAARSKKRG